MLKKLSEKTRFIRVECGCVRIYLYLHFFKTYELATINLPEIKTSKTFFPLSINIHEDSRIAQQKAKQNEFEIQFETSLA